MSRKPMTRSGSKRFYRIIHEDKSIIVADKSPGILTVPLPHKSSRNLKELLDDHLEKQKKRAYPVHRIDRYTSGLVVFAKSQRAKEFLVEQFKSRTPERIYMALVRGRFDGETGTLTHWLELSRNGFRQQVVSRGGTKAITHYKVIESYDNVSLLEVKLETGLKNQIRVQMLEAGHPLVGDRHYEPTETQSKFLDRQALHAHRLGFVHPDTKEKVFYEAPLARDMERVIGKLRKGRR